MSSQSQTNGQPSLNQTSPINLPMPMPFSFQLPTPTFCYYSYYNRPNVLLAECRQKDVIVMERNVIVNSEEVIVDHTEAEAAAQRAYNSHWASDRDEPQRANSTVVVNDILLATGQRQNHQMSLDESAFPQRAHRPSNRLPANTDSSKITNSQQKSKSNTFLSRIQRQIMDLEKGCEQMEEQQRLQERQLGELKGYLELRPNQNSHAVENHYPSESMGEPSFNRTSQRQTIAKGSFSRPIQQKTAVTYYKKESNAKGKVMLTKDGSSKGKTRNNFNQNQLKTGNSSKQKRKDRSNSKERRNSNAITKGKDTYQSSLSIQPSMGENGLQAVLENHFEANDLLLREIAQRNKKQR